MVSDAVDKNAFVWADLRLMTDVPNAKQWKSGDICSQYSSVILDTYQQKLLLSDCPKERLHGLCSTVFWGFLSGTDFRVNTERALSRVKHFRDGKQGKKRTVLSQNLQEIDCLLQLTKQHTESGNFGAALYQAMQIKFLGMSFASKVVMFMSPENAAVYDSVIAKRLQGNHDAMAVSVTSAASAKAKLHQADVYEKWCSYCRNQAISLNTAGHQWCDWDGKQYPFRAVDVERAIFALGR